MTHGWSTSCSNFYFPQKPLLASLLHVTASKLDARPLYQIATGCRPQMRIQKNVNLQRPIDWWSTITRGINLDEADPSPPDEAAWKFTLKQAVNNVRPPQSGITLGHRVLGWKDKLLPGARSVQHKPRIAEPDGAANVQAPQSNGNGAIQAITKTGSRKFRPNSEKPLSNWCGSRQFPGQVSLLADRVWRDSQGSSKRRTCRCNNFHD